MKTLFTAAVIAFALLLCLSAEPALADVFASNVRVTQPTSSASFDLRFSDGTGAAIRFTLNDHADSVLVRIKSGVTVLRTIKATNVSVIDTLVLWDGKNTAGSFVANGTYSIEIATYDQGHGTYTETAYPPAAGLSTRGVTAVTNPALKSFGYIFSVDNGGLLGTVGVSRFAANAEPWGNVQDSSKLTTTGIALGPGEARHSPHADQDGYIYVLGRTAKQVYRFHADSLNVTMIDSSYGTWYPYGLDIMKRANGKRVGVVVNNASGAGGIGTDSKILGFHLNPGQTSYFGAKDTLVIGQSQYIFWDIVFGRDSVLYASFTSPTNAFHPGVAKFNLAGKTWPLKMSDTSWTVRADSGLAGTTAIRFGAAADGSQDIVYFVEARIASGNPPSGQGIYAITGLNNVQPTRTLAYADKQNNASINRSGITVDGVGNLVYFENSNEEIALISPPTGPNSFTLASLTTLRILESESIGAVRIDANNDGQPDRLNETVSFVGTVNSVNFTASANRFQYTLQDETGGIIITKGSETGGGKVYKVGDRLSVTGAVAFFSGSTEVNITNVATDVTLLDSNNTVTPKVVTIDQLNANGELYESVLIKINGVGKTAASVAWPASGSDANMTVWDGFSSTTMRIDHDADVDENPEPAYPLSITGVGSQFSSTAPYHDGYQITLSSFAGITPSVSVAPNPHFTLVAPAKNSTVKLDSGSQVVTFRWNKAIDLNNDNLIYQWVPLGGTAVLTGTAGADSFLVRTGDQLKTFLAGKDTFDLRWTVYTKDPTNALVKNVDTSSVKLIRGKITGVESFDALPKEFATDQNYPNPFNPSTSIKFALPKDADVQLKVYDLLGREVRTLVNNDVKAGRHEVVWDGRSEAGTQVASGVYLYRITAGTFVAVMKMMMLK